MKKLIIISLIMILAACSSNENKVIHSSNSTVFSNEMNLEIFTDPAYQQIAVSENGIYYSTGNYLYFYDFETSQHVFLCNKPNCKHAEEINQEIGQECNAYLENASFGGILNPAPMFYYDGYLYMIQSVLDFQTGKSAGDDIVRIDPDGSNRTSIVHTDGLFHFFFLHRDNLYYVSSDKLYRYSLSGASEPEELLAGQLSSFGFQAFCVEDSMYFSVGIYEDFVNEVIHYGAFIEIDLNTLEVQVIKENQPDLYFAYINDNEFAYIYNNDTYLYDNSTGEEQFLCDEAGQVHVTEDYIFVYNGPTKYMHSDGERTLVVFDKKYNRIDSITFEDGIKHWNSGAYNNQLFLFYNDPTEYFSTERIYTITVKNGKLKQSIFSEKKPSDNNIAGYQWNINDYK